MGFKIFNMLFGNIFTPSKKSGYIGPAYVQFLPNLLIGETPPGFFFVLFCLFNQKNKFFFEIHLTNWVYTKRFLKVENFYISTFFIERFYIILQ